MSKTKTPLSAWPTDLALTPQLEAFAKDLGLDAEQEWAAFHDSALANGRKYADWRAAFRTWCRNAAKWKAERGQPIGFITPPPRLNAATVSAIRDNEEIEQELNSMTEEQKRVAKQAAIRKLSEIYRSLK